jgi:hypothetical protein
MAIAFGFGAMKGSGLESTVRFICGRERVRSPRLSQAQLGYKRRKEAALLLVLFLILPGGSLVVRRLHL